MFATIIEMMASSHTNLRLAADGDNLGRETLALREQALPPLDKATHAFLVVHGKRKNNRKSEHK
jgi:hypothetical protein